MHEFNAQELANTAWAFAKAGHEAPKLFAALADEAVSKQHATRLQDPRGVGGSLLLVDRLSRYFQSWIVNTVEQVEKMNICQDEWGTLSQRSQISLV